MKERTHWLDVAKFFGIVSIYIGHFAQSSGLTYAFVFRYHVPLFFFLSGCTESISKYNFQTKFVKRCKSLLIPFYFFSLLSIILYTISNNSNLHRVSDLLISLAQGCIRNQFIAPSLWFFTCLFTVSFFFELIKIFKSDIILVVFALLLHITSQRYLPFIPSTPSWFFNIDSAMYYMIYYSLGYVTYKKINQLINTTNNLYKVLRGLLVLASGVYTAFIFWGHNIYRIIPLGNSAKRIIPLLTSLTIICFVIALSNIFKNVSYFRTIGSNTLYLCGNEFIIKHLVLTVLQMIGLNLSFPNPVGVYIYVLFLISIVVKFFVPIQKSIFFAINKFIDASIASVHQISNTSD